jgi:hypothetical protein
MLILLRRWRHVDHSFGPLLGSISFLTSRFVVHTKSHRATADDGANLGLAKCKGYAFCALVTVPIVPLTLLGMARTIGKLLAANRYKAVEGAIE